MREINDVYQAAIDRLREEIRERTDLLDRFERVLYGVAMGPDPVKTEETVEKEPRGSTPPKEKGPGKGKGKRVLSQTAAAKTARAWRAKQKAKAAEPWGPMKMGGDPTAEKAPAAGSPTGAHEALAEQSAADVEAAAKAQALPPQDPNRKRARNPGTKAPGPTERSDPEPRPTTARNGTGTLAGLNQREALKRVLGNATRPLDSTDILNALHAGGYKFSSNDPRAACSVMLATYGGPYITERRAGRVWYQPTEKGDQKTS